MVRASGTDREDGRHPRDGARFVVLALGLLLAAATTAVAETGLSSLAEAGAPQLALALLERERPDPSTEPQRWEAWLRQRVELLSRGGQWQALAAALAERPAGMPEAFYRWLDELRADALLRADDPREARAVLARLIWTADSGEGRLRRWREMVVQSYVAEGRSADAYAAMLRLRQDYGSGGTQEGILRARVLIGSGRPEAALAELKRLSGPSAEALMLLARLRSGAAAADIRDQARRQLGQDKLPAETRERLWAIVAEAAGEAGDHARQAQALEVLLGGEAGPALRGLFTVDGATLWDAYLAYAQKVGNEQQLLLGDDAAWLQLAATESERYPVRTRSILALLALQGATDLTREEGHRSLAGRLIVLPGGSDLLHRLYGTGGRFPALTDLPSSVRHLLADRAVARGDLGEAARLLQGLSPPPGTAEQLAWQLRRAKIFVLGGEYEAGARLLEELAGAAAEYPAEAVDRLVQVGFDLQTVGLHDQACAVFETLMEARAEPARHRELLYWMADSRQRQGRLREAARLYLRSAILPGADAMDPWAQTARYEAAKALAGAGLTGDAETLYRQLLAATSDPQRRAVLLRDLEQLRLQAAQVGAG